MAETGGQEKAVCASCFEDEYLRQVVTHDGDPALCEVCGVEQPKTYSLSRLGEILGAIIQEHYTQGDEVRRFGPDDDDWFEQEGETLEFVVQEILGQYFDFNDEIVRAVIDAEHVWPPDGDIPFFEDTANYVEKPVFTYARQMQWDEVLQDLKHGHRFFSHAARVLFEELFGDIDKMKCWGTDSHERSSVVELLAQGSLIYRARGSDSEEQLVSMLKDPFLNVGPPTPERARAGRMNSEGVSMFYGAKDVETCLAEIRPPLGGESAVIAMQTSRPLRLLDFTRFSGVYRPLSYFQSNFTEETERFAFLRRLGRLISKPVIPGREADYLITQTMAEYLAHEQKPPFDGVLFSSVQRDKGVNIVVFPQPSRDELGKPSFPLSYVADSIKVFSTRAITYAHHEIHKRLEGDVVVQEYDPLEDSDEE